MDRREFASLVPALLAAFSVPHAEAASLSAVVSGAYPPAAAKAGSIPKRTSRAFTKGLLKAGNIQLEIHQTTQEVGAPHEPEETHLHTEIWFVQEGEVTLTINGTPKKLQAGDVGICVAGDRHYIQNTGNTPATYLVVAVGPPE
ncbi:MAG: cupin domain-containing protein [Edaphobacter sp.]|uniref:cupin domain-containing protein n=1 Tax=Edaphobacter sp. TaxID=1934404 RepID=UPI0023925818|nr:cupin domain-containing protein [Edaphobacter sp.]MDE1175524.1 cupin domain-containing protein [Edaphobacter sp.]